MRKTVLGTVLIGFVGVLMVGFGMNSYMGKKQMVAAKVDRTEISYNEFSRRAEQLNQRYRQQFGQSYDQLKGMLNIEQQSIDSLISDVLLDKFTDQLSLTAGTKQIEEKLLEHPYFSQGFSPELYRGFLQATGMSGAQLEAMTRKELIRGQLANLFSDLSAPSAPEIEREFQRQNTASRFNYVSLKTSDYRSQVDVGDQTKIAAFYEEAKENYRKPEAVGFEFIELKPEGFLSQVEVTENDVKDYYEARISEFMNPRELNLRQIFIKSSESALEKLVKPKDDAAKDDEAAESALPSNPAKEKAEKILTRLKAGEQFSKLATELSEDKDTAGKGGDLGWVQPEALPEAIQRAANNLEVGEFSGVIETPRGFFLISLEGEKEAEPKPLSEVKESLERELRQNDAPLFARAAAEGFVAELKEKSAAGELNFGSFAKEKNYEVIATASPMAETESQPNIPNTLVTKALDYQEGDLAVVEVEERIFAVHILERKPSSIPTLESVKEKVIEDYRAREASKKAQTVANELLKEAQELAKEDGTKALAVVAAKHKLQLKETADLKKTEATGEPFTGPGVVEAAFSLNSKSPLAPNILPIADGYILLGLTSQTPPKETQSDAERTKLVAEERQQAGSRLFMALISKLKADADQIWVNPDLISKEQS